MIKRLFLVAATISLACSSGAKSGGVGGSGGAATGAAGSAGSAGSAGTTGSGGDAGNGDAGAGGGGTTGAGGSAGGAGTTGRGGTTGAGGAAGTTGTAGRGGTTGAGGGTAGSGGTTGAAGRGGTTGAGGAAGTSANSNSVLERNKNPSRDGHFVQPALTRTAAARMMADAGFAPSFAGAMWASPLYMENGPAGKGVFIAVSTNNDVIALDETTGATVWTRNIGAPGSGSSIGCESGNGGIPTLGIISTPVIDAASRTIFVAGAIGGSQGITGQVATALSIDDGTVRSGWPVDVSAKLSFNAKFHNQRGALSLLKGILYVPYGAFVGDCGTYKGRVVAIQAASPTTIAGWAAAGDGEGVWAPGGLASDGDGVFASTGNSNSYPATHQDSEEVVRLTGMATATGTFYPARWQAMDGDDGDLGAVNPIFVRQPGSTPANMIIQISKDGHLYVLDAANLGGNNGHKADLPVLTSPMWVHTTPAAYTTSQGVYVVFTTEGDAMCPGGGGSAIVAVRITAGSPPTPRIAWCGPLGGAPTGPIATTTDGQSDAIVWYINDGRLVGLNGDTGAPLYTSGNNCSGVQQWTSPIAVKGRIVAGGNGHLCSWSPH